MNALPESNEEDPTYPLPAWKREVSEGDTRRGYQEWVGQRHEMNQGRAARDIPHDDLVAIVEAVRDTLYPNGDTESAWSSKTLEAVSGILYGNGLLPPR